MTINDTRKLLFVLALAVVPCLAAQAKPEATNLPVDQIPAPVKAIVTAHLPGITLSEATVKTDEEGESDYNLRGASSGRDILIKIETYASSELKNIRIVYEADAARRKKGAFEMVGLDTVPAPVIGAARSAVKSFMPDKAEHGLIGGRDGYQLEGKVADFQVEVKVLATGEIVAIDKTVIQ